MQLKLIHTAARKIRLNDEQYRLILRNVGGVESSKDLSNAAFEKVMAAFEDNGFPGHYWRDKVARRNSGGASDRELHLARELYDQYLSALNPEDPVYPLDGLVYRVSGRRTREITQLSAREAYNLIELLKETVKRIAPSTPSPSTPSAAIAADPASSPSAARRPSAIRQRPYRPIQEHVPLTQEEIPF